MIDLRIPSSFHGQINLSVLQLGTVNRFLKILTKAYLAGNKTIPLSENSEYAIFQALVQVVVEGGTHIYIYI